MTTSTTTTAETSNPVGDELGVFDLETGASGALDRTSSFWISDVSVVRQQIRFLAALRKPNGGLAAPAYVVYALLLISWCVVPLLWVSFSADGSAAVCGEGRIELAGSGEVHLQRDDGSLCHGGNRSYSYESSGIVHASSVCTAVGARLCTVDEVVGGDVLEAGCSDPDTVVYFTWTSSTANGGAECPPGEHMTAAPNHHFIGDKNPPKCTPDATDLLVFCCADARINSHTTCPTIQASGNSTRSWPDGCTSASSCSELAGQWPEGVWRLTKPLESTAFAVVFSCMYIPMTLAIWHALCKIGAPDSPEAGELHALLRGVDQLSEGEIGEIRWWRRLAFGITVPLSAVFMFTGISFVFIMPDAINHWFRFGWAWFTAVFMSVSVLVGAGWLLTLKTASVTACRAASNVKDLVVSWVSRLPRRETQNEDAELVAECVDEIGTAICILNTEIVPQLGKGWGVSIAFGMVGSVGLFTMVMPNNIKNFSSEKDFRAFWLIDALVSVFFGALPLVLLSLPASLTDRCIQLETCLSELLMPYETIPKSKSRYVVTFETSQQLEILEKYMQQQNNKQGSAFLCSSYNL
jgi:hypothetical protein